MSTMCFAVRAAAEGDLTVRAGAAGAASLAIYKLIGSCFVSLSMCWRRMRMASTWNCGWACSLCRLSVRWSAPCQSGSGGRPKYRRALRAAGGSCTLKADSQADS
jgi:hypothetical protein